jgi:hypothetical protein
LKEQEYFDRHKKIYKNGDRHLFTPITQRLNISFSFAPLGATHNNPPQRGGLKPPHKFRPERAMQSGLAILIHCPYRAIVCVSLPAALRRVVTHCP